MKFIFSVVVLIVLIDAVFSNSLRNHSYAMFQNWKSTHGKNYSTPEEENDRFQKWSHNLKVVANHNYHYDQNQESYRLEMNHLADMTSYEMTSQMTGFQKPSLEEPPQVSDVLHKDLPEFVDWRLKGYVTDVKYQGYCGGCYAFSAMGALEGQHAKKTGVLRSLSVQNILDCSGPEHNDGCRGGDATEAYRYVMKAGGVDTWNSYPFEGKAGKCRFDKANIGARARNFVKLPGGNERALKEAVATVGPISVDIDSTKSLHLYANGVYKNPHCSSKLSSLTHAVLVVGYGTTNDGEEYWIVKNSWGTNWGEDGYGRMSRNNNNNCGIANWANYPVV